MAVRRRTEQHALNADERQLLKETRGAPLQSLSDSALAGTLKLMRERQPRARASAQPVDECKKQ
ncbi:MAG TPA: hypothetical protein PLD46_02065 [Hyphomicrobium sp.]|nr:hypothetical protein [Hyphomicrobium sp.]